MSQILGSFVNGEFFGARSGFVVIVEKPAPEPEPKTETKPEPKTQELAVRSTTQAPPAVAERSTQLPAVLDGDEDVIDEIAAMLAKTVKLAQTLSPANARRARELMHASIALLNASTVLPREDQAKLQTALRSEKGR